MHFMDTEIGTLYRRQKNDLMHTEKHLISLEAALCTKCFLYSFTNI